jgi:hypothetical protein
MNNRIKKTSKIQAIVYSILFLIVIILHTHAYDHVYDDAFIHFRVAINLVEKGVPYYNPYEPVKVSTSSGWIIFLSSIYWFTHSLGMNKWFPVIISITNALITILGMFIFTKVLQALNKQQIPFILTLFFQLSYISLLLPSSMGLMETPFALLLMGLGIYLLCQSKPSGLLLLGFSVFLRLELLIPFVLVLIFIIYKKYFQLKRILGPILIGIIPMLIFDFSFFHTIIPNSIEAKSKVYSIEWFRTGSSLIFSSLPVVLPTSLITFFLNGTIFLSCIIITTVMVFREKALIKNLWPLYFSLWSDLIIGGYIVGHVLTFPWYTPLFTIPLLITIVLCSTMITHPKKLIIKSLLGIIFFLSVLSICELFISSVSRTEILRDGSNNPRVKIYLAVGTILNQEYPKATVLTSEIGGLGYAFHGKILDAAGLASPEALNFHPLKVPDQRSSGTLGAIPPGYVQITNPDIIVSFGIYSEALRKDEIINRYNLFPIYSSISSSLGDLTIYIRKDLPVSEKIATLKQFESPIYKP